MKPTNEVSYLWADCRLSLNFKSFDWTDANCTYLHGFGQLRHSNMPSRYSVVTSFKQLFTSKKLKDTKKMIHKSVKKLCYSGIV